MHQADSMRSFGSICQTRRQFKVTFKVDKNIPTYKKTLLFLPQDVITEIYIVVAIWNKNIEKLSICISNSPNE